MDQRSSRDNRVSDADIKYIREHKNAVWSRVISSYVLTRRHREKQCQIKKKNLFGKFKLCLYPFPLNLLPRYALKIGMRAYWGMK